MLAKLWEFVVMQSARHKKTVAELAMQLINEQAPSGIIRKLQIYIR